MKTFFLVLFTFIFLTLGVYAIKRPYIEPQKAHDRQELIDQWQDYTDIAGKNHIKFTKQLYLEFSHITDDRVIGYCHYGDNYRTIRIDIGFWNISPPLQRWALMAHELSHCLCTRDHDYDHGKPYLDVKLVDTLNILHIFPSGYLSDNCPMSIMHPTIPNEDCLKKHKEYYSKEMLDGCVPW